MDKTRKSTFAQKAAGALADTQLRDNLRFATQSLRQKRMAVFDDPEATEALRDTGSLLKAGTLTRLPELLEQLEARCTENGMTVHWAETTDEANRIVLSIMEKHGARKVVKGKSMVSEEMHFNAFMKAHGKEALETDLGEFIIQLNNEPPSHIIVPAIHKNRKQIGKIFADNIPGTTYTEDTDILLATARRVLREHYRTADMGLSGVNFAVAETGTLCLVENEGNGRMCTTVPPVHVALMGLEKVVEKLEDVPPLYRLLCGSATGQRITTYFNMIKGPRRKGEKDGPTEVHLVILDNGRSRMLGDPQLRRTLQCIRCGTCLNHCPVYTRIGGHAYDATYPGPIGSILMPQLAGLKAKGDLAFASSLCNACSDVCPVKIPIPELLRRMRNESYLKKGTGVVPGHGTKRNYLEWAVWKGWRYAHTVPLLHWAMLKTLAITGRILPKVGPLKTWSRVRTKPVFAKESLKELIRQEGIRHE
ncbi:LutB/LldF family L-lactate oxidation iron-sulfur protein [Desulfoluna butyratoxydans]|uniref:Alpha-helical ferredoxin n=1 Tax=Desulfoluna butyratoxydans TaxID=231438 RepID=A0A4V6ILX9_9BACT|nr:LutB/LldF family L-lactate oxidation iron-sulfur protein [Desulfoluna butyratoxydans]VFQ46588.1 alpha-helical ferredoxin [Desulfoluna butyratoxydans]